ncbi:uncharacterized protein LOC116619048 [Nematostella vectensis]|uniref:uncharacterized protein LOC116619048 n=1 Tax=Nematostella vectensis TaxID=45351 RepID=UPI0020771054|nr:uncharacterized protein LOC116619048 [Nematostella vectensis]
MAVAFLSEWIPQNPDSIAAVYSQSWPIPDPKLTAKKNAFQSGRSLNRDWYRSDGRLTADVTASRNYSKGNRSKSATSTRSSASNLFLDQSDDEIDDTVKEFKLTLQLFKRLTQQVRDVNQYMNTHRVYSFKHYMNNDGVSSPALRRSQLAAALSRREIPATQGPNEPITDLGPSTLPARIRQERSLQCDAHRRGHLDSFVKERRSPSPTHRSPLLAPPSRPASCLSRFQSAKSTTKSSTDMDKKKEKKLQKADEKAKMTWIESDEQFDELFVPETKEAGDLEFRFHDPYPQTWVDEEVEDACFRGSKKVDPFMHRLAELENVKEETILWERLKEEKARQSVIATQSRNRVTSGKNTRQPGNGTRVVSARTGSIARPKTPSSKLRGSSARINSVASNTSKGSGVSGDESDILTFRKSGYDMDVSFTLGSMFPDTRPKEKKFEEEKMSTKKNQRVSSAPAHTMSNSPSENNAKPLPRPAYCEACKQKKGIGYKHSCGRAIPTLRAMRAQYDLKASECYDIVEIARTLEHPCKEQMIKAKSKSNASYEDKVIDKGIVPSKSNSSQRRISLTSEGMAVRGINPTLRLIRPSTGRCKSGRKSAKRRR